MILLGTDFGGLVIRPRARVAMVRTEHGGRLEVVDDQGILFHRPGPLAAVEGLPFVRVAPGTLVHPGHASVEGDDLALPGGWRVQGCLPAEVPREAAVEDPILPGGVRASEVLYVDGGGSGHPFWVTDRGPAPGPPGVDTTRRLASLHPDLRHVNYVCYVNPLRVRSMRRVLDGFHNRCLLEFDQGTVLELNRQAAMRAARNLGAAHVDWVGGETDRDIELRILGLRRWPFRLLEAPADFLAREFDQEPARLLGDLVLQTVEAHGRGERTPGGHRSWYYTVARVALQRAGHLESPGGRWEQEQLPEGPVPVDVGTWKAERGLKRPAIHRRFIARFPLDQPTAWRLVCLVWAWIVGELALFTYRDGGFRDAKTEARWIGGRCPAVVVLVEKDSLKDVAFWMHERHGVTVLLAGGTPTWIGTERLAWQLLALGIREVRVLSYCDFDPPGWDMPTMLAHQLARYGLATLEIRRMITPACFTEDELRRLSVPLETTDHPSHRTRLRRFMKETGGISGQRRGIQADLLPEDRARRVFEEVAGDWLG